MTWDKTIGTLQNYSTVESWIDNIPDTDSGDKQMVYGRLTDEDFNESGLDINLTNWTPDSSNYVQLCAQAGTSFDGETGNGPRIYANAPWGRVLRFSEVYSRTIQIEVENTSTTYAGALYMAANNCTVSKCLVIGGGNYATLDMWSVSNVVNTVVRDGVGLVFAEYTTSNAINCTIHNCTNGIDFAGSYGGGSVKNCAIFDNTDDIDVNSRTITIDSCATDDGDGTNSVSPASSDWDNEFTDYASDDFTILNTGNLFEGSAITNADDSNVPTDDIVGTARNTGAGENVSIGAYEYATAGSSNAPTGVLYGPLAGPFRGPV